MEKISNPGRKIAIISDTHSNFKIGEKIKKILKNKEINFIIHCGDIGGPDFLKKVFKGFRIRAVLGNMDQGMGDIKDYQEKPNIIVNQETGFLEINFKKIAFNHFPDKAKLLAESNKYDFVFYGHTHKPWEEKIGNCRLLNPGNSQGTFYPPSFAIYDLEKNDFELKRL